MKPVTITNTVNMGFSSLIEHIYYNDIRDKKFHPVNDACAEVFVDSERNIASNGINQSDVFEVEVSKEYTLDTYIDKALVTYSNDDLQFIYSDTIDGILTAEPLAKAIHLVEDTKYTLIWEEED